MALTDPLANVLSHILNCERRGKQECTVRHISNLIKDVLNLMKSNGYVGDINFVDDGKGGTINIKLLGKINECGIIKPRFSVTLKEFEKFEKRYLLAKDFGILIISTSSGLLTHYEAKEKRIGGKLVAYIY